ncbi:MAG TPA: PQQ-binding-like beta-propeller repeat protein [Vicinamibacterales bacterium]|jgi:quinoprotein glucose dehydrogenase
MKRLLLGVATMGLMLSVGLAAQSASDWSGTAGDAGAMKYAPASEITPANVSRLKEVWTYRPGGPAPIVINNTMYFASGGNVVALKADSGTELWKFPLRQAAQGAAIRRGMTYWPGTPEHAPRVLVTIGSGTLVQLDAKTGQLVPGVGTIDLVNGIMDRIPGGEAYTIASPVAVYRNLAIFPGRTGEHNRWGIPGDLRAFDLLTGKQVWRFHTVPHPEDPNFGTWGLNGWQDRKGPGSWQPLTVDNEHGLVFVALGNAVDQNYGNSRPGSNLYSASVVAIDAATGEYKWHFQTAHHDIYDGDLNAPPMFAEVNRNGQRIPAIVQGTKTGFLFFLNRLTGEPIFGVEERPVPPTDALGDAAWPTQPIPLKPEPITRLSMTRAEVSKISPEAEKYCTEIYDQAVQMGPYTPYGMVPSIVFPGSTGGASNNGGAFDPGRGMVFATARNVATIGQLSAILSSDVLPSFGKTKMPFEYYLDVNGYPCNAPPWAELFGINANTGDIVWRVPLGEYKELTGKGIPKTGTATNSGAPLATAGGVVFIGGTSDGLFRAFDAMTGKELWSASPGFNVAGYAISYTGANRKQYVVISGPRMVAYALQ